MWGSFCVKDFPIKMHPSVAKRKLCSGTSLNQYLLFEASVRFLDFRRASRADFAKNLRFRKGFWFWVKGTYFVAGALRAAGKHFPLKQSPAEYLHKLEKDIVCRKRPLNIISRKSIFQDPKSPHLGKKRKAFLLHQGVQGVWK